MLLNFLRILLTEIRAKPTKNQLLILELQNYFSFNKRRTLFTALVEYQFKYCPIACMFHSRHTSNKINRLHKRALRCVFDDYVSIFAQLQLLNLSISSNLLDMDKLKFTRLFMIILETV